MCGIFGLSGEEFSPKDRTLVEHLARKSQLRGLDTSGFVFADETIRHIKSFASMDVLLQTKQYEAALAGLSTNSAFHIFGHARLVTNGAVFNEAYNQPITSPTLVGVHNGIVSIRDLSGNELTKKEHFENWDAVSDSYIFYHLLDELRNQTVSLSEAFYALSKYVAGHLSVAFLDKCNKDLFLYTNTGSLYVGQTQTRIGFASEKEFLQKLANGGKDSDIQITQLPLNVLHKIPFGFQTIDALHNDPECRAENPSRHWVLPPVIELIKSSDDRKQQLTTLRRCTKCILPETYPFITFDAAGVCNFCNTYSSPQLLGEDSLVALLDKHRSNDSRPDCIVGLSGGRDSCYGLHLLKRQYGMSPVAYTYDWGLTTDMSRINQSLMCQQLGVEHIIRSANVEKKRKYIRQNINAWIARPQMGMVPLFMAGDKEFIEQGRKLRRSLDIPLVIFCTGNPFEHRDFFTGFAGVSTSLYDVPRMYDYPFSTKLRLAGFYALQYLSNPRYFNSSFFDSLYAFLVSFLIKEDFCYLFRYIPWNEDEIDSVLKNEYGWRSYTQYGENQWRMGDGQTALTNYIFLTFSGFSEYDNFRSLQIREGVISRDDALRLTTIDNQPKYEAIEYLCATVGINMNYLLKNINAAADNAK